MPLCRCDRRGQTPAPGRAALDGRGLHRQSGDHRHLGLPRPTKEELAEGVHYPPGTVHLPDWVESEWLKQLVAEELVTVRTKRGFARLEWQKLRERNEALDCRVYARAAAWIAGADRWTNEKWRDVKRPLERAP